MTNYIIEYSDGPRAENQHGAYPDFFRRIERQALSEGIQVKRVTRLGTIGAPYRFLEVIDGQPKQVRRYGDLVQRVFGGAMRIRRGYPVSEVEMTKKRVPFRGDRIDNAGVESFPASDAPPW